MKATTILSAAVLFAGAMADVTLLGCYKTSAGVKFNNTHDFNSRGRCSDDLCGGNFGAIALQQKRCYCGDSIPVDSDKVDDSNCNISCPGWPEDTCGSKNYWSFYNTGLLNSLPKVEASGSDGVASTTTSSSSSASTKASVVTAPAQTVVVTSSSKATSGSDSGGKSNTAAIAAGVVVGVLAIAGIIGGLYFFMRNRKRRAIEEEHRRNATINSMAKPPINSAATSFNDTRLDPVMAQRRMSDGSIADNQDYSRRILKVTN